MDHRSARETRETCETSIDFHQDHQGLDRDVSFSAGSAVPTAVTTISPVIPILGNTVQQLF